MHQHVIQQLRAANNVNNLVVHFEKPKWIFKGEPNCVFEEEQDENFKRNVYDFRDIYKLSTFKLIVLRFKSIPK